MKVPAKVKKLAIQLFWAVITLALLSLIVSIEAKTENISKSSTTFNSSQIPQLLENIDGALVDVVRVSDGDTLWIDHRGTEYKVRMIGINSNELQGDNGQPECAAEDARERLTQLVEGKQVTFIFDDSQDRQDRYGRLLGYIERNNEDVGNILVREGLAKEFTFRKAYSNQSLYRASENTAQQKSLGIWSCQ